jgi:hypothetical protein
MSQALSVCLGSSVCLRHYPTHKLTICAPNLLACMLVSSSPSSPSSSPSASHQHMSCTSAYMICMSCTRVYKICFIPISISLAHELHTRLHIWSIHLAPPPRLLAMPSVLSNWHSRLAYCHSRLAHWQCAWSWQCVRSCTPRAVPVQDRRIVYWQCVGYCQT